MAPHEARLGRRHGALAQIQRRLVGQANLAALDGVPHLMVDRQAGGDFARQLAAVEAKAIAAPMARPDRRFARPLDQQVGAVAIGRVERQAETDAERRPSAGRRQMPGQAVQQPGGEPMRRMAVRDRHLDDRQLVGGQHRHAVAWPQQPADPMQDGRLVEHGSGRRLGWVQVDHEHSQPLALPPHQIQIMAEAALEMAATKRARQGSAQAARTSRMARCLRRQQARRRRRIGRSAWHGRRQPASLLVEVGIGVDQLGHHRSLPPWQGARHGERFLWGPIPKRRANGPTGVKLLSMLGN